MCLLVVRAPIGVFSLFFSALFGSLRMQAAPYLSLCVWHLLFPRWTQTQTETETLPQLFGSWTPKSDKNHIKAARKDMHSLQKQLRKLLWCRELSYCFAWEILINWSFICWSFIAPTLIIPLNHPPLSLPCGHLDLWGNKCVEFLWGLFGNLSAVNLQVNTTDQRPPYAGREVGYP